MGGKKSKKKRGRVKGSGDSSKQRKELSLEGDASPEEEEGVQKASPLPHSPPDEL